MLVWNVGHHLHALSLTGHEGEKNFHQPKRMRRKNPMYKISVDRLTVCGNVFGNLDMFIQKNEYIKNSGFAKFPYRYYLTFLDGSILQIADQTTVKSGKLKMLRYEFNPNNTLYEKVHLSVLKMFKDPHITRIDIAFDIYDVDMRKWKWIDMKSRPSNIWYDGLGNVETYYIGGKDSEMRLRIYDKAKEQKKKDKIWWRVEVQLRGKTAEMYRECILNGDKVDINPFDDIVPVVDGDFPELDIKTRAMVKYLIQYPSGFEELSHPVRRKYKRIMQNLAGWKTVDLRKAWEEAFPEMRAELQSWFNFTHEFLY